MAHYPSSKKRIRSGLRCRERNRSRRSCIRSFVKKVEQALTLGDASKAREALQLAQPHLHRGAHKGLFHARTAARKISRLSKRIRAL